MLEQAYLLEPSFSQAYLSLIAAYILHGDQERADEMLVAVTGRTDVPNLVLAQVYARKKDYPRLLAVWKTFRENEPNNI